MYWIDYHSHTRLSSDAEHPLSELAEAAVRAGLSELCVTDHYDTVTGHGKVRPPYNWQPALDQIHEVREAFHGKLTLRLGMEFGSGHLNDSAVRNAPEELDFVIGSAHNHSPEAGGLDFYYVEYRSPEDCYRALDDYMNTLEKMAPLDYYSVLGHLIYPLRYMRGRDGQDVSMDRYMDRLQGVMKTAAQGGRGIEFNTYTGRTLEDWLPVLKLYREVGGEIITTGSDAHVPEFVSKGIPEAYDLLKQAGFRYITTFECRKPKFVKL